jgi:hypothetical protein
LPLIPNRELAQRESKSPIDNHPLCEEKSLMMFSAIATLVAMLTMVLFPVLIPVVVSGVHFVAKPRHKPMDRHIGQQSATARWSGRVADRAMPIVATA